MLPHPLTKFNGVCSRDNLLKTNDEEYIINLDDNSDIGTPQVALYVLNNDVTFFDSFGLEHIPTEIEHLWVIKT